MANDVTDAMVEAYRKHSGGHDAYAVGGLDAIRRGLEAALAARPEPEGMKTTAEERARWRRIMIGTPLEGGKVHCLVDDTDTLLAEVASLKVRLAAAEAERDAAVAAERERCAAVITGWIDAFGEKQPEHVSARDWAVDAMNDCLDAIRARGGSDV